MLLKLTAGVATLQFPYGKKVSKRNQNTNLVWVLLETSLSPKVWGEVSVGLSKSLEEGLDEVTHGLGLTNGAGEAVTNSSKGEKLLFCYFLFTSHALSMGQLSAEVHKSRHCTVRMNIPSWKQGILQDQFPLALGSNGHEQIHTFR